MALSTGLGREGPYGGHEATSNGFTRVNWIDRKFIAAPKQSCSSSILRSRKDAPGISRLRGQPWWSQWERVSARFHSAEFEVASQHLEGKAAATIAIEDDAALEAESIG
jgi:hypothetical protein